MSLPDEADHIAGGSTDDGEAGDDNGIAGDGGIQEQFAPGRLEDAPDPRLYLGEITDERFKPFAI